MKIRPAGAATPAGNGSLPDVFHKTPGKGQRHEQQQAGQDLQHEVGAKEEQLRAGRDESQSDATQSNQQATDADPPEAARSFLRQERSEEDYQPGHTMEQG